MTVRRSLDQRWSDIDGYYRSYAFDSSRTNEGNFFYLNLLPHELLRFSRLWVQRSKLQKGFRTEWYFSTVNIITAFVSAQHIERSSSFAGPVKWNRSDCNFNVTLWVVTYLSSSSVNNLRLLYVCVAVSGGFHGLHHTSAVGNLVGAGVSWLSRYSWPLRDEPGLVQLTCSAAAAAATELCDVSVRSQQGRCHGRERRRRRRRFR